MRKIITIVLMSLLAGNALVFAREPAGNLMTAAFRETARLGRLEARVNQATGTPVKQPGGHPVLIGAAVGAGLLGVAGYFGASCSVPPPNDEAACGTHYKGGMAFIGASLGAGIGALIGLAFRR